MMVTHRANPSYRAGGGDSNMTIMLGLKLLLLAFFILLNAMSSLEALKANAVLESVHKAFSGRLLVTKNLTIKRAAVGPLADSDEVQEVFGHLFQSLLPAVRRENTLRGPVMMLELSAGTFFGAGGSSFQPGRRLLLQRLAAALGAAEQRGVDYEFTLLHSGGQDAAEAALAGERMAVMAAEMARYGAPSQRLGVGLFPGLEEKTRGRRVRLVLRINRTEGDTAKEAAR